MKIASHTVATIRWTVVATALFALAACGNFQRGESEDYVDVGRGAAVPESAANSARGGRLLGPEGFTIFSRGGDEEGQGGGGIGVNSFLWRASLDTISFMPLASADPFGGVIITDWYSPPETPNERFKMTVYILDRRLRADGIRVALFRQQRTGAAEWADVQSSGETAVTLENAILTRARELRINSTVSGR
jgi:hypothetical protein